MNGDDPVVVDIMETVFDGDLRILTARNGRAAPPVLPSGRDVRDPCNVVGRNWLHL